MTEDNSTCQGRSLCLRLEPFRQLDIQVKCPTLFTYLVIVTSQRLLNLNYVAALFGLM